MSLEVESSAKLLELHELRKTLMEMKAHAKDLAEQAARAETDKLRSEEMNNILKSENLQLNLELSRLKTSSINAKEVLAARHAQQKMELDCAFKKTVEEMEHHHHHHIVISIIIIIIIVIIIIIINITIIPILSTWFLFSF